MDNNPDIAHPGEARIYTKKLLRFPVLALHNSSLIIFIGIIRPVRPMITVKTLIILLIVSFFSEVDEFFDLENFEDFLDLLDDLDLVGIYNNLES